MAIAALHPHRILKYSATLLISALLIYAVYFSWQSWREVKSDQSGRLATIAELNGNTLDTYFNQLEIGMRDLGMDLTGPDDHIDLDHAYTLINRFQKLHTDLGNIILLRADGQLMLTGNTPNRADLPSLAGNPAFKQFRNELRPAPSFMIGRPVLGNIDKNWVIAARLGITDQDGKLSYILSANLPNDLIQRLWADKKPPVGITTVGLVRDDGYLVNRYPAPDAENRDQMYGKPMTDVMFNYLRARQFPTEGQTQDGDGTAAFVYAMRRLKHYPLTLFVSMPVAEIKAARWRQVETPFDLMTLMLAGILLFYGLSLRRRRVWSREQRREMHRQAYEQALLDENPNEIYMFKPDTLRFNYANDYALDNLGCTLDELQTRDLFWLHPGLSKQAFADMTGPLLRGAIDSVKYQATQTRANGESYPVEVILQLIQSDEGQEFLAIVNDLTTLKAAEENIERFNAPEERRGTPR